MFLFAHHVELQHVPILVLFFVVGFYAAWTLVDRLLRRLTHDPRLHSGPVDDRIVGKP
jgi:hypothetical protein